MMPLMRVLRCEQSVSFPFPESEGSKQYDPMHGSFRSVNEPLSSASIEYEEKSANKRAKVARNPSKIIPHSLFNSINLTALLLLLFKCRHLIVLSLY